MIRTTAAARPPPGGAPDTCQPAFSMPATPRNPLHALHAAGQSIWLDYIDRTLVRSGELARRIDADALTGMTSNPTIFEKALAQGTAYDEQLRRLSGDRTPWAIFEAIETDDVRDACDVFRPTYDAARGADGFVSIEVSPGAANDSEGTVQEARRLWRTVDRPNVMIKVPGTREGCTALRRLIADGINVNVTLLFALSAYAEVIDAYLAGLEDRSRAGHPLDQVASVASFFVSRVDTEVDKRLERVGTPAALALRGAAAEANAVLAYALFRERFAGPRWEALALRGARVQRPLWASTGTKNPSYSDVKYVESLIGPDTVNTLPPATLDAFRDHGKVARTADADVAGARDALRQIEAQGVSLAAVTDQLLVEGIASFQKSFDGLLAGIERKAGLRDAPSAAGEGKVAR
jgi:transaldolase